MLAYPLHNLTKADRDCDRITDGIVIVIRPRIIAMGIPRQQQNQPENVKMALHVLSDSRGYSAGVTETRTLIESPGSWLVRAVYN